MTMNIQIITLHAGKKEEKRKILVKQRIPSGIVRDGTVSGNPSLDRFWLIHPCDRQTDRRTDRIAMAKTRWKQ